MESFITVAIIVLVLLYNLISNYMKEQQKNHERKRALDAETLENFPPVTPLFQKKENSKSSSSPLDDQDYYYNDFDNLSQDYSYVEDSDDLLEPPHYSYLNDNVRDSSQSTVSNNIDIRYESPKLSAKSEYLESSITSSFTSYLEENHIGLSSKSPKSEIEEQYERDSINNRQIELELNSSDDYKRAFIYSLIFERKY